MTGMPLMERRRRFGPRVNLGDAGQALGHFAYAVQEQLKPLNCPVTAEHVNGLGVRARIECRQKDAERVCDRLAQGVLHGWNDYRFTSLSRPVGHEPDAWIVVHAYPDTRHDKALLERYPPVDPFAECVG